MNLPLITHTIFSFNKAFLFFSILLLFPSEFHTGFQSENLFQTTAHSNYSIHSDTVPQNDYLRASRGDDNETIGQIRRHAPIRESGFFVIRAVDRVPEYQHTLSALNTSRHTGLYHIRI